MFLQFYGLREQPFGVTPNPRFLYQSDVHREALASLIYAIESELGFTALIAEAGMGKTTLLYCLMERYRESAHTALVFSTQCTSVELMRLILAELDEPAVENDLVLLNERFRNVLMREAGAGRRVILVLDEAQNLAPEVLETVRLLSNFETANAKLLHIVLSGQPQLLTTLQQPSLSQLTQRIQMFARLTPFNLDDTRAYIDYRLRTAAYEGPALFTPGAMAEIAVRSRGVPREINRLCFNALSLGCALKKPTADEEVLNEVADDLDLGMLLTRQRKSIASGQARAAAVEAEEMLAAVGSAAPRIRPTVTEVGPAALAASPLHVNPSVVRMAAPRPVTPIAQTRTARPPAIVARIQRPLAARRDPRAGCYQLSAKRRIPVIAAVLIAILGLAAWIFYPNRHSAPAPDPVAAESATAPPQKTTAEPDNQAPVPPATQTKPETVKEVVQGRRVQSPGANSKYKPKPQHSEPEVIARSIKPGLGRSSAPQPAARRDISNTSSSMGVSVAGSVPAQLLGPAVRPAVLLRRTLPAYPLEAQQSGIAGEVTLDARIGKDGRLRDVRGVSGDPLLTRAAADAVRNWLYQPAEIDGRAIETQTTIVVDFVLPK